MGEANLPRNSETSHVVLSTRVWGKQPFEILFVIFASTVHTCVGEASSLSIRSRGLKYCPHVCGGSAIYNGLRWNVESTVHTCVGEAFARREMKLGAFVLSTRVWGKLGILVARPFSCRRENGRNSVAMGYIRE